MTYLFNEYLGKETLSVTAETKKGFCLILEIASKQNTNDSKQISLTANEVLELKEVLDFIINKHKISPFQPLSDIQEAEIID